MCVGRTKRSFYACKTKGVSFERNLLNPPPSVLIDNQTIEWSNSVEYLGVTNERYEKKQYILDVTFKRAMKTDPLRLGKYDDIRAGGGEGGWRDIGARRNSTRNRFSAHIRP